MRPTDVGLGSVGRCGAQMWGWDPWMWGWDLQGGVGPIDVGLEPTDVGLGSIG